MIKEASFALNRMAGFGQEQMFNNRVSEPS
jgi:hypothetical protein